MKLALLLLLCASSALAAPPRYLDDLVPSGTRLAPTLATEGMSLDGPSGYPLRSFTLAVCATTGNLGGTGYLRAWVYHGRLARWMRNPELDKAVTATSPCQHFPDFAPLFLYPGRRVLFAADDFGVSVTVSLDGDTTL